MKSETDIQRRVMMAASAKGISIWRNNVGVGWQGRRVDLTDATVNLDNGNIIHVHRGVLLIGARQTNYGLCEGSSDLIGFTPGVVGGETLAVFTAFEVKTQRGKSTDKQRNFLEHVARNGGIARIIRSPDEV